MVRLGAAVVAMEVAALLVAVLGFGTVVLLVGVPLLLGTVAVLAVVGLSGGPRRRLQQRRAARWADDTPAAGGLMSGFFEAPAPR